MSGNEDTNRGIIGNNEDNGDLAVAKRRGRALCVTLRAFLAGGPIGSVGCNLGTIVATGRKNSMLWTDLAMHLSLTGHFSDLKTGGGHKGELP